MTPSKANLRAQLVQLLTSTRDQVAAAQRSVQEGATHAESRQEGSKDMRATEQSYIARGQALRVTELEADRSRVVALELRTFTDDDPVALSALVQVESDGKKRWIFVAPAGGGLALQEANVTVQVVTPTSPLGQALVGAMAGDELVIERGGKDEELTIVRIA